MRDIVNFSDADYLIIINLVDFLDQFECQYPLTIAHETIHIVDLCNQEKHPGEWIEGQGAKYSLECIDKLEEDIKNELLKYDLETGRYDRGNGVTIGLGRYIIPK